VANIALCRIHRTNCLLDRHIRRLEADFLKSAGGKGVSRTSAAAKHWSLNGSVANAFISNLWGGATAMLFKEVGTGPPVSLSGMSTVTQG
jgi:hypothetical protein